MESIITINEKLTNKRAMRREKNQLYNIVNALEKVLDDSLLEEGVLLTDEQWDCIEQSVVIAENRMFILEQALKKKKEV